MSTGAVVLLVVVLVAVAVVVAWFVGSRVRSRGLRERFGPEYDRRVRAADNRREAERELSERSKRHAELDLRPVPEEVRARFVEQWGRIQERFVDQPGESVAEAEALVQMVMRERGYPVGDFERQAADLSVEHAAAVDQYRVGHEILARHQSSLVSTEELRRAMVGYREIFDTLMESHVDSERRYHDASR